MSVTAESSKTHWSYPEAFSRHQGLFTTQEQQRLRASRVAIAGMGGVGGIHLVTLARLGIGAFHVADPDRFELANFNRQYGASMRTVGEAKAEVMAREAQAINPDADLCIFPEAITRENVDSFLEGVDVLVDGIDFFAIASRRLLFQEAHRRGIWAITAGPLGFSTAWQVFSPDGMTFDEYYDLTDSQSRFDQLVAFVVGLSPRPTHLPYLDLEQVHPGSGRAPSAGLGCHLCSGVAAAEVIKILLDRSPILAAPWFFQFDAYRQTLRKGRLWKGNRHPLQRLKRWLLRRRFRSLGWEAFLNGPSSVAGEGLVSAGSGPARDLHPTVPPEQPLRNL